MHFIKQAYVCALLWSMSGYITCFVIVGSSLQVARQKCSTLFRYLPCVLRVRPSHSQFDRPNMILWRENKIVILPLMYSYNLIQCTPHYPGADYPCVIISLIYPLFNS
jgi:hypothetical protein